jgi:RNA polymerase sigma factor for flagellar operon FliA
MRVLIVEDDAALGLFLQKGLKLEGHEVDWVGDGEAALEYAVEHRPDLIVLDLSLPKKDGTEVLAEMNAQFRIRGAILDSLRTLDWSPRELRRKGRAVEEAIRSVTQRLGRAPVEQEIAGEMELSLEDYQQLLGDLKGLEIGSLHMERSEDSGDEELSYIPGSPEEDPLFRCLKGEMKQRLIDAIEELPEKERMVLTLYYYEELTMKEIGQTLGVVESRVSQIHSSAVLRLRTALAVLKPGVSGAAKQEIRNGKESRTRVIAARR